MIALHILFGRDALLFFEYHRQISSVAVTDFLGNLGELHSRGSHQFFCTVDTACGDIIQYCDARNGFEHMVQIIRAV